MSVVVSLDIRNFIKQKPTNKISDNKGFFLKGHNGSIVILIHGLTGTPSEMRFIGNHLNKKGYSVICPRLANHTESIWVLKNTRWQDLYESIRQVLIGEELADYTGPMFVSGLSFGALLALLLGHEFREKIAGISCLAPTLFYDGWNTPFSYYFFPFAHTPLRHFFFFKEEPPYGIKNEAIQQRIHKYYATAKLDNTEEVEQYGYPYFPVDLLYQLTLLVKHLTKKLPDIRIPVQLIQAKDDDVASVKNSKFIYDRINSEIKEMVLLYDSYHVITADHERGVVAEKVAGFFDAIRT